MRILHTVESYYPEIGGMPEVVRQLSERLAGMGHQVTVATRWSAERKSNMLNNVQIRSFRVDGNDVRGMSGEMDAYRDFLLQSEFDIVTFFASQQWATDVALPILDRIRGQKVNVPTGFSGLYWPEYKDYYEKMKTYMKGFDMNVFLSNSYRDIDFARANGIEACVIIPNGAAGDEFLPGSGIDIRKKLGIGKEEFFILHVGSYTSIKGHKEAMQIYLKSKIRNAVMVFVGHHHERFQLYLDKSRRFRLWKLLHGVSMKRHIITQLSRAETVAAYKEADLFLFPSNIECSPIVLFEAMAARTPFLATDVGNSSEIVEWSGGGMILPTKIDEQGFSHALIGPSVKMLEEIATNKTRMEKLKEAGFKAWQEKFSWEVIAKKYEELYFSLVKD